MANLDKLYYFASNTEVKEGDHIIWKELIRRKKLHGRVSYMPEFTANEIQEKDKYKELDFWVIELKDKYTLSWLYSPEDLQPHKRLSFVSRSKDSYKGINSKKLEDLETELAEQNPTTFLESIAFSLFIIGVLVAIVWLIKWVIA